MAELPPIQDSQSSPEPSGTAPIGDSLTTPNGSPEPPRRWQGARSLLVWIGRWALLGVGVSGAWSVGVLVAQFLPAATSEPPLQEVVLRRSHRVVQKLRRLPDWWQGEGRSPTTGAPRVATPPPPPSPRPIALTESQRQQIAAELEAVQGDLQRLRDRASALERQLGLPSSPQQPLESRLAVVENRFQPSTEAVPDASTAASDPEPAPETPIADSPAVDPLFQTEAYRVTLPSDLLFDREGTLLKTEARQLLDSILLDVGRYPGATILVSSYTDAGEAAEATQITFKQAIAVQRYLASRLEEEYHWVPIGYGNSALGVTRPTPLSRRIAIAIVPP